ncbi:hypothetical protein JY651_03590 [Pyxidicoccus parkwayensis]|uniref:Beta-ketoacyl synthase N-terminal domain-containing protein n=2 Tax=Pyxidicoccus parkwayensis TaxID=2813578 RepID=A0ABX7PC05_9BACT|nr:hypothetical protein JY651_03590 [Pyxidicoccus parkwaysis]
MVTPVGLTARSTAAAVRAGIARTRLSPVLNKRFKPLITGFLDEEHLPPVSEKLSEWASHSAIHLQRLLRLATGALQEAARGQSSPLPLLLALPAPRAGGAMVPDGAFLEMLVVQSGIPLDVRHSRLFPHGRAGGLLLLREAQRLLTSRAVPRVLVGGVDTYFDLGLLTALDAEERLLAEGLSDGFAPGEGAAFLCLRLPDAGQREGAESLARISALGLGREEGHRSSSKPYRGEGLAAAFQELFQQWDGRGRKVQGVYAGFNGENFWAKEWGVASLRHARYFADPLRVEHPVEYMGDPGAALGPMLVALAALGLHKGYREGGWLAWCSSDQEERAAVIVEGTRV